MKEENLKVWVPRLAKEPFVTSDEAEQLLNTITDMVSRDKLVEWERLAKEAIGKSEDDIAPGVHIRPLVGSVIVGLLVYFLPNPLSESDPVSGRCLALLVLVVSMWVTKAIPYFATGLLIPVLVTVMGVVKNVNGVGVMTPQLAAQFVMDHMANHTTVSDTLDFD